VTNLRSDEGLIPIPSYRGYDYIAQILASHGYIVVSISANGISALDNLVPDSGMLARAQLIQHHLDRWKLFNATGGAPFGTRFVGKVDLNNVGMMGHSRGGEGVVRHFIFNKDQGSPYGIRAVFPLAPTDLNRPVINNVPLAVLLPYCDGDVEALDGVHFYCVFHRPQRKPGVSLHSLLPRSHLPRTQEAWSQIALWPSCAAV
jgi:hypothetical protein